MGIGGRKVENWAYHLDQVVQASGLTNARDKMEKSEMKVKEWNKKIKDVIKDGILSKDGADDQAKDISYSQGGAAVCNTAVETRP